MLCAWRPEADHSSVFRQSLILNPELTHKAEFSSQLGARSPSSVLHATQLQPEHHIHPALGWVQGI